jgi:hypothetical protein
VRRKLLSRFTDVISNISLPASYSNKDHSEGSFEKLYIVYSVSLESSRDRYQSIFASLVCRLACRLLGTFSGSFFPHERERPSDSVCACLKLKFFPGSAVGARFIVLGCSFAECRPSCSVLEFVIEPLGAFAFVG